MRISDWSSDVCSSDLIEVYRELVERAFLLAFGIGLLRLFLFRALHFPLFRGGDALADAVADIAEGIKGSHVRLLQEIHALAQIERAMVRDRVCQIVALYWGECKL